MKIKRVMVQLPKGIKAKLDRLRRQGTSISGFIRNLLEEHFKPIPAAKKGR